MKENNYNIISKRLALLESESNQIALCNHLIESFLSTYETSEKVIVDLKNYLSTLRFNELLEVELADIYNHLLETYIRKIYEVWVVNGKMDFDNYDRTKDDEVNKLTGIAIEYVDGLNLPQLRVMTEHPYQHSKDFVAYLTENYPELLEEEDDEETTPQDKFIVTVSFKSDFEHTDDCYKKVMKVFSKWSACKIMRIYADNLTESGCNVFVKLAIEKREGYTKESVEKAVRNRIAWGGTNVLKFAYI
jgi:hypothetical protein